MSVLVAHRDSCRLCDSDNVKLVVKLNPVPLAEKYTHTVEEAKSAKKYPIDLYMCGSCSHVQLLDVINSNDLWSDYTYHSGQTKGIYDHFQKISDNILKNFAPTEGSLIVDIGSNDGTLLSFFQNKGYKVQGVDPAKEIAENASSRGIPTIASVLTPKIANTIYQNRGKASVVTAFNVFAHADNLGEMADSIQSLLTSDGIFVFEVQYLLDIVEKVLIGTIFHEHMSHHSLRPLMQFLNAHNMEIIDVERVTIQKGSLIGYAQLKGGPRKASPAVDALLQLEQAHKLDQFTVMEALNTRIENNKKIAAQLKSEWIQKKFTVAGYGAARSGPTLIEQFGFSDVIQYILDDHPQKINRFAAPGVPVIATSELLKRKPDIVVILAWIHARAIIEKSQDYIDQGGKFIICTPDIRVVDQFNPL